MATIDKEQARQRLEAERERIQSRIANEEGVLPAYDPSPTDSRYGNHAADEATNTYEEEKALGLRAHYEAELKEVEDALRRVENGSYGQCEECGREIPAERLDALPYARFCVECQSKAEARR